MKKIILAFIFIAIGILLFNWHIKSTYQQHSIRIKDITLQVDIASSIPKQIQGLSGRKSLAETQGMLFVYSHPQSLSFWMKDMLFPIDIIWLDQECRIIHIAKAVAPCAAHAQCQSIQPELPAQYVLETVANFTDKYLLKMGDYIPVSPQCHD